MAEESSRQQGSGSSEMARGGVEVVGGFSTTITRKGRRRVGRRTGPTIAAVLGLPACGQEAVARARGQRSGTI
jgi:hypothetical protein